MAGSKLIGLDPILCQTTYIVHPLIALDKRSFNNYFDTILPFLTTYLTTSTWTMFYPEHGKEYALFKHHNLTGSNVLGPCYLYHSVSSTQLLKSVQYLNFRLGIQIKHWPKIDFNSFSITYQNHQQSRPKLITFLENKVKLISKELWELKAQTKKMINYLIKVLL